MKSRIETAARRSKTAARTDSSRAAAAAEWFISETGLEVLQLVTLAAIALTSPPRRHRNHVVARDVGRTRQAARKARGRFQRLAVRLPDRADLQGQLHRDGDGGDLRVPLAQPAGHRPGQRDRDRDHDGGQGRDLSGVRTDARPGGAVLALRLSARRHRLLRRRRRQHAVVSVQRLDADPVLQQGSVSRRRPRSRGGAEDLARGRRGGEAAARGGRRLRLHHVLAVLDQCREFFGLPQSADRDPRPTASAGSTPNWSSTIRWWCATSPSSRNGRPRKMFDYSGRGTVGRAALSERRVRRSSSARRRPAPTSRPIRNSRSATA